MTVAEVVLARRDDPNPALSFEGRSWTWAEVVDEMLRRAAILTELTPTAPPHVGLLLDNTPEYLFCLGGAALCGRVIVGLNSTRRGEGLARDVRHTDCAAVVTDAEHRQLLDGLDLGGAAVIDIDGAEWRERAATATPVLPATWPVAEDLYLLLFTAGSTGAPKAVRATHARAARAADSLMGFQAGDVVYCAMPMFHGNALFSTVLPAMGGGAAIALRRKFSASAVLDDVRASGAVFFSTVGRALAYVLATPPTPYDRDHKLRFVLAPESATSDVVAFQARFGCPEVSGYGSSENVIIFLPQPGLPKDALGVPEADSDVAVIDPETGAECPPARFDEAGRLRNADESIGEIVSRNGLGRFEGYYNNDEATAQRTRGGWYWSGDLGYRDADGVFYFAGRTADWLRVDGENFAAAPVERVLASAPGVTGAVVFGVPDERTVDDQVMAVLEVADPTAFDPDELDAYLRSRRDLGTKWTPRYVRLLSRLPLTATNKVDKTQLRRERWDGDGRVLWRPDRRGSLRSLTDADRAALAVAVGHRRQVM